MKRIRFFTVAGWSAGLAVFSMSAPAAEAQTSVPSPEEAAAPAEETGLHIKGFTGEEQLRLRKLRAWLIQRRLQRESGVLANRPHRPLDLTVYPEQQLLTPLGQRYALGFRTNTGVGTKINRPPFIVHGRNGRIYHRLDFDDKPARSGSRGNPITGKSKDAGG